MLDLIRRKRGSPWVKAILIFIAVSFFGGFGMLGYCTRQQKEAEAEANRAASVNGSIITLSEVYRLANTMQARKEQPSNEAEWAKAREDALDMLINDELIYQEAVRLDLVVGQEEVDLRIAQTFQTAGIFQPDIYMNYLANQGLTDAAYREKLKRDISIQKIIELIGGAVIITDEDIRDYYRYNNEQASLAAIEIDPEAILYSDEPTTTEIRARFDNNPEGYVIPEKRKIRYSCFDSTALAGSMDFSDEEIEKEYENSRTTKYVIEPRRVKMRQITFRLTQQMTDEEKNEKREKAKQVMTDARLGTSSFENLASLYSEDPATRSKGGDMGWIDMSTKSGAVAAAFDALKPGDISDPVETPLGVYIFKMEDEVPGKYEPLGRVRREIIESLRSQKASQEAADRATKMADAVRDGSPFENAAKAATAEVHVTDYFDQTATELKGVPEGDKLIQASFQKLYDENTDAAVVEMKNGSCVVQIAGIEDSHDASFEEATPLIIDDLKKEGRKKKANGMAEEMLKKIGGAGQPFEKAASGPGVKLVETGYFSRGRGMVPNIGFSQDFVTAAFALPPHDPVSKEVFEVGGKIYLVKLLGRKEADPSGFDKDKEMITLRLTYQRQSELAKSWIETLKSRAAIDRKTMETPNPQEESL